MTKKEFRRKEWKLFLIDNVLLTFVLYSAYIFLCMTVEDLTALNTSTIVVIIEIIIWVLLLLFIVWKPYYKKVSELLKQGHEKTEKEKLKEIKRRKKIWDKADKKLNRQMKDFREKWDREHVRINSLEDLRTASLLEIIRWRMK